MAIMKFNGRAGLLGLVVATAALSTQQPHAPDVFVADALSLRSLMFRRGVWRARVEPTLSGGVSGVTSFGVNSLSSLWARDDAYPHAPAMRRNGWSWRSWYPTTEWGQVLAEDELTGVPQYWSRITEMLPPIHEHAHMLEGANGEKTQHQRASLTSTERSKAVFSHRGSPMASSSTTLQPSQWRASLNQFTSESEMQPTPLSIRHTHDGVRKMQSSPHSDHEAEALGKSIFQTLLQGAGHGQHTRASSSSLPMPPVNTHTQVWEDDKVEQSVDDGSFQLQWGFSPVARLVDEGVGSMPSSRLSDRAGLLNRQSQRQFLLPSESERHNWASLNDLSMLHPHVDAQVWKEAELDQMEDEILNWVIEKSKRDYNYMAEFDAEWDNLVVAAAKAISLDLLDTSYYNRLEETRIEAWNAWRNHDQELARGLMQSVLQNLEDLEVQRAIELSETGEQNDREHDSFVTWPLSWWL